MDKRDFCRFRNTWDCEEQGRCPKDCESFELDENTLTKEEKRLFILFEIMKK